MVPPAKKVEQYNHLKERRADTILLFKAEDGYEVYQDDAIKVGKVGSGEVVYPRTISPEPRIYNSYPCKF